MWEVREIRVVDSLGVREPMICLVWTKEFDKLLMLVSEIRFLVKYKRIFGNHKSVVGFWSSNDHVSVVFNNHPISGWIGGIGENVL